VRSDAGRRSGPVDTRSRVLVRVATAGLVAVLLCVTGGAVWATAGVDQAVQEVEHLSAQGNAWVQASRGIAEEQSAGNAYLAGPSHDLRLSLREAGRSLAAALDFLVVEGEPEDAASARAIKAKYDHLVPYVRRMLAAVDAGEVASAKALQERPVHPAYGTLQHKINAFAEREQQEVTGRLAALRHRQHVLRLASLVAAGVGVAALGP
jgi:hypothetical protein